MVAKSGKQYRGYKTRFIETGNETKIIGDARAVLKKGRAIVLSPSLNAPKN